MLSFLACTQITLSELSLATSATHEFLTELQSSYVRCSMTFI